VRGFQKHQEHDLKHPGSMDLITTKQNRLPSFMDRSTCNLLVLVEMSPQGPGTLAFANRKLCKAAGRSKKYIYNIYIFVAFRIPRVQRSPIIGVHRFVLSKTNLAYLL
jgi:hypothetical protein